jgi:hypothetical protein
MGTFAQNPVHFASDCAVQGGRCVVARENVIFLDDGSELAAVDSLQMRCGRIVIVPDSAGRAQAWLYHTSCDRMTDVVEQLFPDCLGAPARFPQPASEMTVGELLRRRISIPYDDCRARVEGFDFGDPPED